MDARDAFKATWEERGDELRDKYGGLYEMGLGDEWLEYLTKGDTMLVYYDEYDRANPFWDDVVEVNVEERSFVEILDDHSGKPRPGRPLLSGKIDLVVHRKGSGIWTVDHKTAASAYDARALDVDDQLTGYAYIWYRITGEVPSGALYNALIKEPPKPPRVLKDGSLSKDKQQRTTHALYMQAIVENEFSIADYVEILEFLEEKGWHSFFMRDGLQKNLEEIESFEWRLNHEYEDMQRALSDDGFLYPNPGQRTCPGCGVISICQAMEEGGDVDFIKDSMFIETDPRVIIPEGV